MQPNLFPDLETDTVNPPQVVPTPPLVGQIFHARWGYNATNNTFVVVLDETEKTVVVAEAKKERVSGDDMNGTERPVTPTISGPGWRAGSSHRLHKRLSADGKLYFKDDYRVYSVWDGKPCFYNCD